MSCSVLYLSSLCTIKEYDRLFSTYGTTSSHASQKFHRAIVKGLKNNGLDISAFSCRVIGNPMINDLRHENEIEDGILFSYLPISNKSWCRRPMAIAHTVKYIAAWAKNKSNPVICCDCLNGEFQISLLLLSIFKSVVKVGIVTDVPLIRATDNRKGIKALPIYIKNFLIKQFDGYVFLTEEMNSLLNDNHKPYVIIEGVVDPAFNSLDNKLEDKRFPRTCMFAGLLEKQFGIEDLVESFHTIKNDNIELRIYGKGSSVPVIKEYELIDKRIKYMGEALNSVILEEETKATLLINPRGPDGEWTKYSFPSKNIEYMASGTPLLAYKLDCIPDEYSNYYFEIPNKDELGDTIIKVLNQDDHILFQFGHRARKWINNNKSASFQTKKLATLITSIGENND